MTRLVVNALVVAHYQVTPLRLTQNESRLILNGFLGRFGGRKSGCLYDA